MTNVLFTLFLRRISLLDEVDATECWARAMGFMDKMVSGGFINLPFQMRSANSAISKLQSIYLGTYRGTLDLFDFTSSLLRLVDISTKSYPNFNLIISPLCQTLAVIGQRLITRLQGDLHESDVQNSEISILSHQGILLIADVRVYIGNRGVPANSALKKLVASLDVVESSLSCQREDQKKKTESFLSDVFKLFMHFCGAYEKVALRELAFDELVPKIQNDPTLIFCPFLDRCLINLFITDPISWNIDHDLCVKDYALAFLRNSMFDDALCSSKVLPSLIRQVSFLTEDSDAAMAVKRKLNYLRSKMLPFSSHEDLLKELMSVLSSEVKTEILYRLENKFRSYAFTININGNHTSILHNLMVSLLEMFDSDVSETRKDGDSLILRGENRQLIGDLDPGQISLANQSAKFSISSTLASAGFNLTDNDGDNSGGGGEDTMVKSAVRKLWVYVITCLLDQPASWPHLLELSKLVDVDALNESTKSRFKFFFMSSQTSASLLSFAKLISPGGFGEDDYQLRRYGFGA
ncbi:hypothetical protein ACTXT7_012093 [Hymenolepis weldensis]